MKALLNAIHTRLSSVNISRHLSLKNFLKYNKGKQLTIYCSSETCSNQSSGSSTCYGIMSFISLERGLFMSYCVKTDAFLYVKIPDIRIYYTGNEASPGR